MSQYQDDNEWEDWGPSKSQLKRDAEALQKMGEEIVSLSHSELEKIPLDEELAEAVELIPEPHDLAHGVGDFNQCPVAPTSSARTIAK